MLTLTDLTIFCLPLSVPSFYLAHRLYKKQFLGTVFNQHTALMLVYSGLIIPLSIAISVFRLLSDLDPSHQELEYFFLAPNICAAQRVLEALFHSTWFYGSFVSVLFRFVLMKYSDRGLADDRFWFNGGLRLFQILFWIGNTFFIIINLGLIFIPSLYFHKNIFLTVYRSQVCSQMIRNTMTKEILSKSRLTNFWLKSLIVIFVLLTTLGIYWKKKRILLKIPKYQWNVLTLNQTVALIFLVYTNNLLCDYLLIFFPPSELLFILEELRVILVENLIIRFLLPFFLILNTKRRLPALWTETSWKRREFFMTKINFQSHYPQTEVSFDQEERRQKDLFKYNDRTTTTTLANTAMGSNIPEVSD